MYKNAILLGSQVLLVAACNPDHASKTNTTQSEQTTNSHLISLDSANKMIGSYVASFDSTSSDTDLLSVSFNADQLRAYLANPAITNVKISLAHQLSYINAGNGNQHAGYASNALTLIVSAVSANGTYIFSGNQVMDFGSMCPSVCLPGDAASALFPIN
jgi:hypothetical protein